MGHKGVSKRKPAKKKLKPSATADHNRSLISGLTHTEVDGGRLSESSKPMPSNKGGTKPSAGIQPGHKHH